MAQVKVFGIEEHLHPLRARLSQVIHSCVVDALQFPADKRAHRFIGLDTGSMLAPGGRSNAYTIIEITMIAGRSTETKKRLIRLLFDRIQEEIGIEPMDLEICIYECPASHWGFRGMHGDEIQLDYPIDVWPRGAGPSWRVAQAASSPNCSS